MKEAIEQMEAAIEAMHLQLTMIERFVPLARASRLRYYSPWREEERPVEGIIHAVYVFGTIHYFLDRLSTRTPDDSVDVHIQERLGEICNQFDQIKEFRKCPSLTKTGRAFVFRMISQIADTRYCGFKQPDDLHVPDFR